MMALTEQQKLKINMILFRTIVEVPESEFKIDYETASLWIGSCFTENIGARLKELKFSHEINPFGILYNPASINNSLSILIKRRLFTEEDLRNANGLWYSFFHHSGYSHPDRDSCLQMINQSIEKASAALRNAKILFITLGTARAFQLKETGEIVANCHKLPQSFFRNILFDPGEIVKSYQDLIGELAGFNPGLQIVFTVSPVRHWKDGATGNQISKSTLILAIAKLRKMFGNVSYFPAYEIMMDDLRDYRFYDEDMLHVNKQGVDYIWERFAGSFLSGNTLPLVKEIRAIKQATEHRPFNPATLQYRQFLAKILEKITAVENLIPSADFSRERAQIKKRLKNPSG
jgi:hypothetical protein